MADLSPAKSKLNACGNDYAHYDGTGTPFARCPKCNNYLQVPRPSVGTPDPPVGGLPPVAQDHMKVEISTAWATARHWAEKCRAAEREIERLQEENERWRRELGLPT